VRELSACGTDAATAHVPLGVRRLEDRDPESLVLHGHPAAEGDPPRIVDGPVLVPQPGQQPAARTGRRHRRRLSPQEGEGSPRPEQAPLPQSPVDVADPLIPGEPPPDRVHGPVSGRPDGVEHGGLDGMTPDQLRRRQFAG